MGLTHALTLWQPWAYAICELGKRIENRMWVPHERWLGQDLAIHAGASLDPWAVDALRRLGHEVPDVLPRSALVAVVRLSRVVTAPEQLRVSDRAWFNVGACGWVFDDVRVAEPPVANVRGRQRLWRLDRTDAARLLRVAVPITSGGNTP